MAWHHQNISFYSTHEYFREALKGTNMQQADYDGRTVLHIAAAEGHLECVRFLVEKCNLNVDAEDRWEKI